jgi:hypothetical protein
MSEKGQGEEATTGTGAGEGTDGTAAGGSGSGSQADQSGPSVGDTQTRDRGEWSYPDPNAPEDPLGGLTPSDFPAPPVPEEGEATEPQFPGGGPTDTRSGWDEAPTAPYEPQGPPQESESQRRERERAEADESQSRRDEGMGKAMERAAREKAEQEGDQIDPPSFEQPEPPQKSALSEMPPDEERTVMS